MHECRYFSGFQGNSYRDLRRLSRNNKKKINNIIVLTIKRAKKCRNFSKFSIVFKLQPLQYYIFSPLQHHHSLPFATQKYRLDAPRT